MRKDQILQAVISLEIKTKQDGGPRDSAYGAVRKCINAVAAAELSESEKKKKLIGILQSFWRGRSKKIDGSKRAEIQTIAEQVFGIRDERSFMRKEIRQYTFQEIYLYYCYVERMVKGRLCFAEYLQTYKEEKQQKLVLQKKKAEQEKKKALEAEQRKIDELCGADRWRYDIFEKHQDMDYFKELNHEEKFNAEDRIVAARLLMEYWKSTKKWAGDKVSKKQLVKIACIQEILGMAQQ